MGGGGDSPVIKGCSFSWACCFPSVFDISSLPPLPAGPWGLVMDRLTHTHHPCVGEMGLSSASKTIVFSSVGAGKDWQGTRQRGARRLVVLFSLLLTPLRFVESSRERLFQVAFPCVHAHCPIRHARFQCVDNGLRCRPFSSVSSVVSSRTSRSPCPPIFSSLSK